MEKPVSLKSARLKISGNAEGTSFDILVEEGYQNRGIGRSLMEQTISLLRMEGYARLMILGATQKAKGFYDVVFQKLKSKGEIQSDNCLATPNSGPTTFDYNVLW